MTEPTILGFDTSAAYCAATLIRGNQVLVERFEPMAKGQAERLVPLLEEVLANAKCQWSDLSAIGVGIGPGNFTGIRISVATARGLALSLGIPAVGVSQFDALALGQDAARAVLCAVPAPRDQVYTQIMNTGADGAPVLSSIQDAPRPPAHAIVIGAYAEDLAAQFEAEAASATYPTATAIALIAATRYQMADLPRPAPLYIKPADAAPSKEQPPVILDDA